MTSAHRLLADREVRALLGGAAVAGVSTGLGLAVVLAVSSEHSIADAGLVAGAMTAGDGLLIPLRGRLVDRRGQGVLLPLAALRGCLLVALALGIASLPVWALCLLAAPAGMTNAPLFASLRALWKDVTADRGQLEAAYTLHAVVNEVLFVLGPLAVVAAASLVDARGAVVLVAACQLVGAALFTATRLSRSWRSAPREVGAFGALESAGMRVLTLTIVGAGFVVGTLDVAAIAFAREEGWAGGGGVAVAALAVGSAIGGLAYGSRRWTVSLRLRYLIVLGLVLVGLAPLGLASSIPLLLVLMLVAGLAVAPEVAISLALIDRVAPVGTATEATTWVIASNAFGAAIGSACAGHVAEAAGAGWALELATVGAAFALVVALVGRRHLAGPATLRG